MRAKLPNCQITTFHIPLTFFEYKIFEAKMQLVFWGFEELSLDFTRLHHLIPQWVLIVPRGSVEFFGGNFARRDRRSYLGLRY